MLEDVTKESQYTPISFISIHDYFLFIYLFIYLFLLSVESKVGLIKVIAKYCEKTQIFH